MLLEFDPTWLGQGWYRTGSPISVSGHEYVVELSPPASKLELSSGRVSSGQPSVSRVESRQLACMNCFFLENHVTIIIKTISA